MRKNQAVHQCLDAFEKRVPAPLAPTIDLMTFQVIMASLRVDVDIILDVRVHNPEATHLWILLKIQWLVHCSIAQLLHRLFHVILT